mmetsp:Transcript_108931/g.232777  ORF Transcript_108931/g.232777 Transcript_108931/m.232777 type:complete len:358 (-) Transcript_108931:70-1143(-)
MASSIRLFVKLAVQTLDPRTGSSSALDVPWDDRRELEFKCDTPPFTIEFLAERVEALIEGLYERATGGQDTCQAQARSIRSAKSPDQDLPWAENVDRHLTHGATILVEAVAVSESVVRRAQQQRGESMEQRIKDFRSQLRFDLNDRVLCNCGARWLAGLIVGTAVPDDIDFIPYLVKTDPFPGVPQRTISVPDDDDEICIREVCFDPCSELHLIKAAAVVVPESRKPRTRFAVGEKVVCRVRNSPDDGLERWVPGAVSEVWPKLAGQKMWDFDGVTGNFADIVPYKVVLDSGTWIYCHRDDHTLIRREGMEPQTRVRGISKRMELRKGKDGRKERVDHTTERRKLMLESESSSDGSD